MADGREKQRQRRSGKPGTPGWMKYAFVVMDAVIIIGATYLIADAVQPLKKPDADSRQIVESADPYLVDDTAADSTGDPENEETDADAGKIRLDTADEETDEALSEELKDEADPDETDPDEADPEGNADPDGEGGSDKAADGPAPQDGAAEEASVTDAPETAPPAPETESQTEPQTEPQTQPPSTDPPPPPPVTSLPYVGNIHALSQDQINAIRANYDCNGRGYGGITYYQAAPSVQSQMDSMGINCRTLVPGGNTVALTFQEGWEPGYTGQLLDILAQKGVKGNFYITHEYASSRPDLVWRMINEGHTVGSHTYACPNTAIAYYALEDIMNDAMQMQQYIHNTFGYDMHAYNYNSGAWSPGSAKMLSDMGYTVVLCSNSYSDYSAYDYIDPNYWLPQLEAGLIPGSIYAFHVTNPVTVQMIGPLIDYIRSRGFTFVLI